MTVSSVPRAQEGPRSPGVPGEWPAGVPSTDGAAPGRPKAGFGFRENRRDARPLPGDADPHGREPEVVGPRFRRPLP